MRLVTQVLLVCLLAATTTQAANPQPTAGAAATAHAALLKKNIIARWNITAKGQYEAALQRGIDVLEETPDFRQGYFTILVTQDQLDELRQVGYSIDVINDDWYGTKSAAAAVPNGGFRTLLECILLMDSIHAAYPSITTPRAALPGGSTWDGNSLWYMKISDNPDVDEDEPEILFTGMHHAREPIGMEIVLETMKQLTAGYGVDTFLTRMVNEREIWFIPILNPDGYDYNTSNFPNGGGMWRKNRRYNGGASFGVDINRNYGYEWGYDNNGSSPLPDDETYRGPSAFSEPETQRIRDFVNSRHFVFMINYHSYSNLILWPWGYDYIYTADDALFAAIGDSMSAFNGYTPTVGWGLYPTNGDSDDWAYGDSTSHARILSYTPEVGGSSDGFWPDPSRIPTLINENIGPNFLVMDLADQPDRIFPPEIPQWTTADTMYTSNFDLTWTDPGGINPAVSYTLKELSGGSTKTDDAEAPITDWQVSGFTRSTSRHASGNYSYYGGLVNATHAKMIANQYYLVQPGDKLTANMWYNIEPDWDYAYAEVSTDGGLTFATLPGNLTTNSNPNGNNRGNGITGSSGGVFVPAEFDLAAYVGQYVIFRLSYVTDQAVLNEGVYFDDIAPVQTYATINTLAADTPDNFYAVTGGSSGDHYYTLSAKDVDGQESVASTPNKLTIYAPVYGDMNNDGFYDALDLSALIEYVFYGGAPAVIAGSEECDGSPGVNVLDIVWLIDFIFRSGPPPTGP